MNNLKVSLEKKQIRLKVNWKLSRNETTLKENFFIRLASNGFVGEGEVAPNIRYAEDEALVLDNYRNFETIVKACETVENIIKEVSNAPFCHSFKFGVSSALTHLQANRSLQSIHNYLKIQKPISIKTSYSIPIMEEDKLEGYLHTLEQFKYIKIKVNKENAIPFVKKISSLTKKPLRIDGNEAWSSLDEYLDFEKEIYEMQKKEGINIQFIEQPLPASMVEAYQTLKPISKFEIMADESIEADVDMQLIASQFHSVNIKLMKAASYENAIKLLCEARQMGLKTMIGCMIETSLGISCALHLSSLGDYFDLDGSLLIENDPYDLIHLDNGSLSLKTI